MPFLATHPDPVCPTPSGPEPDVGSFMAMFQVATGRLPTVLGKPHAGMARLVMERLSLPANAIAFVGDHLETDILMARDHSFVGVLTLTGVTEAADLEESPLSPDLVINGLPELLPHLPEAQALTGGAEG